MKYETTPPFGLARGFVERLFPVQVEHFRPKQLFAFVGFPPGRSGSQPQGRGLKESKLISSQWSESFTHWSYFKRNFTIVETQCNLFVYTSACFGEGILKPSLEKRLQALHVRKWQDQRLKPWGSNILIQLRLMTRFTWRGWFVRLFAGRESLAHRRVLPVPQKLSHGRGRENRKLFASNLTPAHIWNNSVPPAICPKVTEYTNRFESHMCFFIHI